MCVCVCVRELMKTVEIDNKASLPSYLLRKRRHENNPIKTFSGYKKGFALQIQNLKKKV